METTDTPRSELPPSEPARPGLPQGMRPEDRELAMCLRKTLRDANYLLRNIEGNYQLTIAHASLISLILESPQRISSLARQLAIRVPSVTEQVIRLEANGLVQRLPDPSDSRAVLLAVTPLGRRIYLAESEDRTQSLMERFKVLSEVERDVLRQAVRYLNRLIVESPS